MFTDAHSVRSLAVPYLGLYFFHVLHVLEEFWGGFRAVQIMGREIFLAVNAVLLALPLIVFILLLDNRRGAVRLGRLYAVIMILNGLGHLTAFAISGRYFGFAAGAGTGLGLSVFGVWTFIRLLPSKDRR
jgi:hypothetical protein